MQAFNPLLRHFEQQVFALLSQKGTLVLEAPLFQNADIILQMLGERARSELIFIEDSHTACVMRYDFTLAMAEYYLNHADFSPIQYVTSGQVFRQQGLEKNCLQQLSFEWIGFEDKIGQDAGCVLQGIELLRFLTPCDTPIHLEIADIRLSKAILSGAGIPPIKAGRLKSSLRHPHKFSQILGQKPALLDESLHVFSQIAPENTKDLLQSLFKMTGLKHVGVRSLQEIAERFAKKSEESHEPVLDEHVIKILQEFYHLSCPANQLTEKVRFLMQEIGVCVDKELHYFEKRLDLLKQNGMNEAYIDYGQLLNRSPEYYSGFMFSLELEHQGKMQTIGGGGRYDDLFLQLGHFDKIPAIGCEIRPQIFLE